MPLLSQSWTVGLGAECADVERRLAGWNVLSQGSETRPVDVLRSEQADVRRLDEFESVAWAYAHRIGDVA